MDRYDIAIIGTGPAGVSAAITAKVRNKKILLFGSKKSSEKVYRAQEIQNYPGLPQISGEELAEQISAQVAQEIAPYVDGFYLITPFKRVELILRIIKQIRGLLDR